MAEKSRDATDAVAEIRTVWPDIQIEIEAMMTVLLTAAGGSGKITIEVDFNQFRYQGFRPGMEFPRKVLPRAGAGITFYKDKGDGVE